MNKIRKFLKKFSIVPNNIDIYLEALTHMSYANENKIKYDYQRLEFVGDALIDSITSVWLYRNYPHLTEGEMSIIRASAVKGQKLYEFSVKMGLDRFILVGKNKVDFFKNKKIIADIFEAFVAAIYFDQGLEKTYSFIENNVLSFVKNTNGVAVKNPKTILQEYLQLESRGTIEYVNSPHKNGFKSEVFHDGNKFGSGFGKTKKEAEVNAAKNALKIRRGEEWN
ncbi:MAG: ribonuclease III [Mycoplasmatales bacterium]|nr:ribonuclease III [Mycoplasmatales bacterium]